MPQPSQLPLALPQKKGAMLFAMTWHLILVVPTILLTLLLVCSRGIQINRIEDKVDLIMSQLSDLQDTLAAIGADVDAITTDVANLQAALATANANSGADLQPAIDAANAIRSKLDAVKAGLEPAPASDNSGATA